MRKFALLIISSFFITFTVFAASPFGTATKTTPKTNIQTNKVVKDTTPFNITKDNVNDSNIWDKFIALNRYIQTKVAGLIKSMKNNFSLATLFLIALLSIGYGIVHAAGPGHGKTLVISYFLDNGKNHKDAALMSLVVATTHTGSAFLIATIFQVILSSVPGSEAQFAIRKIFMTSSGSLIIIIGLYQLLSKFIPKLKFKKKKKDESQAESKKGIIAIGMAAGIVPCPLSMAIMFLAISLNVYYIGVIAILGMSLGMALLLYLLGTITIKSKRKLTEKLSQKGILQKLLTKGLSIASATLIIIFGIIIISGGYVL